MLQLLGQYEKARDRYHDDKAREYQEKAFAIKIEIGDRDGEATSYGNLTGLFLSLGKYAKADDYVKKAMAVRKGINKRSGEAVDYRHLDEISCKRGE